MVKSQWTWDPDKAAHVSSDQRSLLVSRDDAMKLTNWFIWKRWFYNNTGVGNSLGMWWPSRKGPHSAWVLCDRCGLPFEMATGFSISTMPARQGAPVDHEDIEWTGGPCTYCKENDGVIATGTPLLHVETDGQGRRVIAGSHQTAALAWGLLHEITDALATGDLSVKDAASRLRAEGGPLTRVADWLEGRPVTAATAGVILSAVVGLVGPQLAARDEPGPDYDEDKIVEIIDTVLDHYDRTHPAETQPGHRSGNGGKQQRSNPSSRKPG